MPHEQALGNFAIPCLSVLKVKFHAYHCYRWSGALFAANAGFSWVFLVEAIYDNEKNFFWLCNKQRISSDLNFSNLPASILTPQTPRSPLSIVFNPKVSFVRNSFAHNLYLIFYFIFAFSAFCGLGMQLFFLLCSLMYTSGAAAITF